MALVLKDRVKETTTTTGTGTITLAGAVTGFQSFSVIGNANTTYYAIVAQTPGEWEVGIGTYTSAGTTLSRDTVLASSNSGSLVVFSAGTKDVWCDYPAGTAVFASNNAGTSGQVLASNGTGVAPSWQNVPATTLTISNKTGAYTVVSGDNGTIINCTSGSFTVALTAAASLGAGFNCWVWNTSNTATDVITIDPSGAETIDGVSTLTLRRGEGTQIVCDGTNWATGAKKTMRGYSENIAQGTNKASASGSGSISIGPSSSSTGTGAVSFGNTAAASAASATAVGVAVSASGASASAFGYAAVAGSNYSSAIGANSAGAGSTTATGAGAMALGGSYASGTDSFAAAIADNTSSYGAQGANSIAIGKLAKSTQAHSIALGARDNANGSRSQGIRSFAVQADALSDYSVAIGQNAAGNYAVAITGAAAMALGGSYASGNNSFAAAVGNNTSTYGATNANAIALGIVTRASGDTAVCIGRYGDASGASAMVLDPGGNNVDGVSTASATGAICVGSNNNATQARAFAFGHGANAAVLGKQAYSGGAFAASGDAQAGVLILRRATTDATATVLTSNNSAAGSTNQLILPNNSAYAFSILLVARQQAAGGTASAAWEIKGLIRREANAASTTLVNSATTVLNNAPGWAVAVSADTTNGGLAVTVTGAAATNIRWVATAQTSEVTYA